MKAVKQALRWLAGDNAILSAKKFLYSRSGEPYRVGSKTLRYIPGTRPVKLAHIDSSDVTVRNDARQIQFFIKHIKEGDFVLDVGGHYGQYAVLFASLVGGSGKVITFEPDAAAHEILLRNLSLNPCASVVHTETIALFDTQSEQSFYSRGGDSMSSLARSGLGSNADDASVTNATVKTATLDEYLKLHHLSRPEWMKIDTEGAEINILRGMRGVLQSGTSVLCELHPYAWNEFDTTFDELLDIVNQCGRTIRFLDPAHKLADGPVYGTIVIS
jgi:FkbM family methyltransferase